MLTAGNFLFFIRLVLLHLGQGLKVKIIVCVVTPVKESW